MERILNHINKEAVKDMTLEEFKVIFKPVGQLYKLDVKEAYKFMGCKSNKVSKPTKDKGV